MTPTERDAFLEERSTGIGGSDIASLLQPLIPDDVKYGCRRELWYEKSGIPADYPDEDSGPMQLGRILEPHIARWHMEATGDKLSEPGVLRHPKHPELLVHIDRIVEDEDHDTPGAAEIKALGPDMFYQTKREGIVVDYLLQLQHGMLLSGTTWGKFIVGNRAYGGKPLSWTHEADPDIHAAILEEGPAFWKTLGDEAKSPQRLEPDDKRCARCSYRVSCQGGALVKSTGGDLPYMEELRPLLAEYDRVNAHFCERLPDGSRGTIDDLRLQEIRDQVKAMLDTRDAVAVSQPGDKDRKIYFRSQPGRVSWKTDELVREYERMRGELDGVRVAHGLPKSEEFPPAATFERRGVPFRSLRIF